MSLIPYLILGVVFLVINNTRGIYFKNQINYIYYNTTIEIDNDISGTGNKLKDIAYIAKCIMMACTFRCCEDTLSEMKCGNKTECQEFKSKNERLQISLIITYVIIPYLFIPFLWLLLNQTDKEQYPKCHRFLSKFYSIFTGILIPIYGIILLIDYLRNKNVNKEGDDSFMREKTKKELFHEKEFRKEVFDEEIQNMCDMKEDVKDAGDKEFSPDKEWTPIKKSVHYPKDILADIQVSDHVLSKHEIVIDFQNLEIIDNFEEESKEKNCK